MKTTDILERIAELKRRKNAVILAHNYQIPEVQDAADFVGDSLELSRKAAGLDADLIVFCGVHFMAETAAVLAPGKTVLLPDAAAGCPMADMINGRELRAWKERYPGLKVVCYVNTSAEVKAESDICCTSSNAVNVVNSLGVGEALFVPDKNLAAWSPGRRGKSSSPGTATATSITGSLPGTSKTPGPSIPGPRFGSTRSVRWTSSTWPTRSCRPER